MPPYVFQGWLIFFFHQFLKYASRQLYAYQGDNSGEQDICSYPMMPQGKHLT